MKNNKKNLGGFALFEVLFFLLLAAVLVGGAYYVGKNHSNKTNKNSSDSSATSNKSSRLTFSNLGFSIENKYGWKVDNNLDTSSSVPTGTLALGLPSGTSLEFYPGAAGFGGNCEPKASDKLHQKAECPTEEYLTSEKIGNPNTSNGTPVQLTLFHRYDTASDGTNKYSLCLRSELVSGPKTQLNDPKFGIGVPCVFSTDKADFETATKGVDNSTPGIYQNPDVLKIEEVLKTIQIL